MSTLWSPEQETEYQRMLRHIGACQSCDLMPHDNDATTCSEMDSILAALRHAGG